MAQRARGKSTPRGPGEQSLSGPGVIEYEGEQYLSIERAGDYLGRSRAALFNYIRRFDLVTFKFPLEGKRAFIKRSDLDALRAAAPRVGRPPRLAPKSDAPQETQEAPVERPRRADSGKASSWF